MIGRMFGQWTVKKLGTRRDSHETYLCVCTCGEKQDVRTDQLLKGQSTCCRKCGCKKPRVSGRLEVKGLCRKGHDIALVGIATGGTCCMCRWEMYIKRTYDLTAEEYLDIYTLQKGVCPLCGRALTLPPPFGMLYKEGASRRTEIDHRHIPKKVKPQPPKRDLVRGLLCGGRYAGCNAKLVHIDNVEWLEAAVVYLKNPPAQQIRK